MNWTSLGTIIQERATTVGLQILGALALYIVGRWLINLVVGAVHRVLTKQKIEPTVMRFAGFTRVYEEGRDDDGGGRDVVG